MRRLSLFLLLELTLTLSVCFSQTTTVTVGQGAPTDTITQEFIAAYQRNGFFNLVALPPLTTVSPFGSGGYRQEFQDAAKAGIRYALVRPATPDLSAGLDRAVWQMTPPFYSELLTTGVSIVGYPSMDATRFLARFNNSANLDNAGFFQSFDKNYVYYAWDNPPVDGASTTLFSIADPIFTKWKAIGADTLGPPNTLPSSLTSRFATKGTGQNFTNGAVYCLTSGTFSGRCIFLRASVRDAYLQSQGPAGFLGLPINDEIVLPNGLRRLSFEGGTMEYALSGTPVIKNAISSILLTTASPLRLSAQQSASVQVRLTTAADELVTDRDVFWSTSDGRVVSITGTGLSVTLRALTGGTALITATSEGKTSNVLTVYVASQCCAIGEGSPTAAITQNFTDAVLRNRLSLRQPLSTPVRRVGLGYAQEAFLSPSGARVVLARPDSVPAAYVLTGNLLTTLESNGGLTGPLGFPLGDASLTGTQVFSGGTLSGSPVQLVSGPILSRWNLAGADEGALGAPTSAVLSGLTFNGIGVVWQTFRSGWITQPLAGANAGKALLTSRTFAAKYSELGGPLGQIGAPLNEEFLTAAGIRQEYEGAFLDYSQGVPIQVIPKARKPIITVTPSSVLPGGRIRVSIGGFSSNARIRVTQGTGATADTFDAVASNGAYFWDSIVPSTARAATVNLRAVDATNSQLAADGSYTIRPLTDLRLALIKLSGDLQSGAPAAVLPQALQVIVRDSSGNPLAGIPVTFIASPGASVTAASVNTRADGVAQTFLRLPTQAGIALVSAQVNSQVVTFSARVVEQSLTDFPRLSQAVAGTLGNSGLPLARKGALLASMASVVRFYQQRGVVPTDSGLADINALNNYLRAFCTLDASGRQLCDGFLDPGSGLDPFPNPWRILDFSSGVLDPTFEAPSLNSVREITASGSPVILALSMTLNGQSAGTHFVSAIGVNDAGDVVIADPNPTWNQSLLSGYLTGFPANGGTWKATLAAALRFTPRGASSSAFFAWSSNQFSINSPNASCGRLASWPSFYAADAPVASPQLIRLQSCEGTAPSYQIATGEAPFLLRFTTLVGTPTQTTVSGASPAVYRAVRVNDVFQLTPQTINVATDAIVNAATFAPRLSAGSIISIFGDGLPTAGAGSSLELNGQPLGILFSNGFQLNAALPPSLTPGIYPLRLTSPFGQASIDLSTTDVAPGIFLLDGRQGAILNQDNSINSTSNPAARGRAIVIYLTGLGAVSSPSSNLNPTTNPVTVLIGGQQITPFFAGLAPGFLGLYQINVLLPSNLAPGLDQDLKIRIAGAESNPVGISIL